MTKPNEYSELINGRIYDMSPSPSIRHQRISGRLSTFIRNYISGNRGECEVFEAPTNVKLNENTIVIPDIFVVCDTEKFDEQQYNGAPDWIIEILSPSNASHDLKDKLYLYSVSGVREYWIIDPAEERVVVYSFGEINVIGLYTFSDNITAGIYKDSASPLKVCIGKL